MGYLKAGGQRFYFNKTFFLSIIAYTSLMSILYILNQIADRNSDAINQKHLLIADGSITLKQAYIEIILLSIITVVLCLQLPSMIITIMLFSFFLGIFYSFRPFKIKAIALVDIFINSIGYGFLNYSLGWLTIRQFSFAAVNTALPYVFAVSAIFVDTTVLDIEGDTKSGYKTTGVLLGKINSARLAFILIIACIILSLFNRDFICLIPALISLPLFFMASLKGDEKYIKLSIRIGGPLLILIVGIIFPYFLILSLLIFIFLRIYYKKKFGIIYPNL